jgi:hypothetical protein
MAHFNDTFSLMPEGQQLVRELVERCGEFGHLTQARIPVLLSQRALVERGRAIPVGVLHGACYEGANSATRQLNAWLRAMFLTPICEGEDPDFIIMVDVALWPAEAEKREHLIYHALCHIEQRVDQYGAPKFGEDGRCEWRRTTSSGSRMSSRATARASKDSTPRPAPTRAHATERGSRRARRVPRSSPNGPFRGCILLWILRADFHRLHCRCLAGKEGFADVLRGAAGYLRGNFIHQKFTGFCYSGHARV